MFCPKCGTPNREGDAFCANCGSALNPVVVKVETVAPTAAPAPVRNRVNPFAVILSIFAMIAGINSLLFIWAFRFALGLSLIGLILGITGAIFGGVLKQKHGMANAGIACSSVTLGIYLTLFILGLLIGGGIVDSWWMY